MMNLEALVRVVRDFIARRSEGVFWDFKRQHHRCNGKLVHDVLCLANAEHRGCRYLIFGVDDDYSLRTIKGSEGRRTQANIAGLFRDNARKFSESRFPTFYLQEIEIDGSLVDVLVIEDEPKKPYCLVENIGHARAHHVYTRICDTNTPLDASAQPHAIERMWRERLGLDTTALDRAKRCLAEPNAWTEREEGGFVCCHHDVLPEFTLRATAAEPYMDCNQEWTRGEIATHDNYAGWYELRCHQTVLVRIHYVGFDNQKKNMVAPDWRPVGQGRFYCYESDSVQYAVQRFWTVRHGRDDSKGLRIRGGSSVARDARSRWPCGIDIPVLLPGELEGFLEGREPDVIRGPEPATEPEVQYEIFVRNLLNYHGWRQG